MRATTAGTREVAAPDGSFSSNSASVSRISVPGTPSIPQVGRDSALLVHRGPPRQFPSGLAVAIVTD